MEGRNTMIDNFSKVIMLIPDGLCDTTIGEMNVEDIYKTFKDYETLDCLAGDDRSKSIFNLDVPNSVFEYITTRLLITEGQFKLSAHLHIIKEERKMILCVKFNTVRDILKNYIESLTTIRKELLSNLRLNGTEILYVNNLVNGVFKVSKKTDTVSGGME
jgi:hypothetical protein